MIRWMVLLSSMVTTMFAGKIFDAELVEESIHKNLYKYKQQYERFDLHTSPEQIQQINDPYMCIKLLKELNALRQSVIHDLHDCGPEQEEILTYTRDSFELFSTLLYDQLDILKTR